MINTAADDIRWIPRRNIWQRNNRSMLQLGNTMTNEVQQFHI